MLITIIGLLYFIEGGKTFSCSEILITRKMCKYFKNTYVLQKCRKYYGKGKFRKDKEGFDEYCRLCAEGGDLLCCEQDGCFNGFCKVIGTLNIIYD